MELEYREDVPVVVRIKKSSRADVRSKSEGSLIICRYRVARSRVMDVDGYRPKCNYRGFSTWTIISRRTPQPHSEGAVVFGAVVSGARRSFEMAPYQYQGSRYPTKVVTTLQL
ncbi:hypothetical protein WG66_008330 [Moniliophthora roreri]|nr:hypothetical protein WG66_008330 [Moniliophthora roreri]